MRRLSLLLLLPTLLAAAACGGGDDDDGAAAPTTGGPPAAVGAVDETCPLDAFAVNAVTGLEVGDPDPVIPTGDGVSCTFSATTGDTGIGITTYATTAEAAMETLRGLVDDAEDVSLDFAEAAIWSPSQTTLNVVAAGRGVQVQIADFGAAIADPLQVATELAELVMG